MIEEVERRQTELDVLAFSDLKGLENRQVAVEPGRTVHVWQLPRPVGVWSWATEARSIEILMRLQVSGWIANYRRHESGTWRTEVVSAAEAVISTPCGKARVGEPGWAGSAQAQVNVAQRAQVGTALPGGDPGEIPTIQCISQRSVYGIAFLENVREIDDV